MLKFNPITAPLKKIRMEFDACHILWTVHARVSKFHIWIPHGKIADPYFFFLLQVISLSRVTLLWENQNEILSARYFVKYLSWGLETWSADKGWWVDYLTEIWKKNHLFSRVMALWKFGHFKLASKISRKVFELGAWNLVSW